MPQTQNTIWIEDTNNSMYLATAVPLTYASSEDNRGIFSQDILDMLNDGGNRFIGHVPKKPQH